MVVIREINKNKWAWFLIKVYLTFFETWWEVLSLQDIIVNKYLSMFTKQMLRINRRLSSKL